ncbi:hypothetical protein [Natrarchaeobaculum aegyptiacum]|uniref:DUF8060 domain-containing protein n=1 Tax=Natrarchaeobaculum aegyptiacum TaxID=745377 RepID=A0A2Z2I1V5_9EURY|nr:hypothetical protein [Natrarchaeobaculum aegyptiacum]ARS90568.1 hypothetical protein B1756_13095 [Natrarchaeobaculum aegyptiacum]
MTDPHSADSPIEPDADRHQPADAGAQPPTDGTAPGSPASTDSRLGPNVDDVRRLLAWGALAICSLLVVVAVIQFYGSVTDAIDLWIDSRHQPIAQAAFNLVVVLLSLIGISALLRELSE